MRRRAKIIPFPTPPAGSPRPAIRRLRGGEPGLQEVHRGPQAEALVVKGLLESAGIPTMLRSRVPHSVYPFNVGNLGEVIVLVPDTEAAHSRLLLARIRPA
jgi:Putative prokaryotic signal transducing protein